jgi:branched-chain amino acid transport system substrate-binding protein
VLAAGISGCGGHRRRQPAPPLGTLLIYTSLPFEGPDAAAARSVYDAERLALAQAGGVVNRYKVVLKPLDDASPSTRQWDPTIVRANASVAAGDPSTIAYMGELTPGSSLDSIPILSRAGILQVSPGDTATGLKGATFARVVPPDSDEAVAQLSAMETLGVKRLYLLKDRTTYGGDIAAAAMSNAATYGIELVDPGGKYLGANTRALVRKITRSKAGTLLYAGSPAVSVAGFWNALSLANPTIKKFASAAVTEAPSWSQTTVAARYNTFLSTPGLPRLPRSAGSQFVNDFSAAYGTHASWTSGIFGYVAMSGVLNALYGLGPHITDPRERVLAAFLATAGLPSALGTYSIVDGQTTFQHYVFTRYNNHGAPAPFTPGQG